MTTEQWRAELVRRNEHFGQPTGYWCSVRQGAYRIGVWDKEKESSEVTLPAFWIARYPITVAQYAPFVVEGYDVGAERWWTPEGWSRKGQRTQPWGWGRLEYRGPNQPVIGMTWYEATAFCVWLSEKLQDVLPTGYVVCLPTEAEWEVAAAYDVQMQCQMYPWGTEKLTPERAIFNESKLGHPAPVGCCSSGAATCGAMDMVGNVWEWTANSYRDYPVQSGVPQKDFTFGVHGVPMRGGSYRNDSLYACCGARICDRPGLVSFLGYNWGVRVCVSPRRA